MKRLFVVAVAMAVVCAFISSARAQQGIAPEVVEKKDEKRVLEVGRWYPTLQGGLNLSQAAYSDNWKGGERGSIAWAAFLNGSAERQVSPSLNWLSTLKLLYGQTRRQEIDESGEKTWGDSEKSADQIDFESIARLTKGWAVDPYASVRVETFFQDVSDPLGRELFLNPITFKESLGVARKFMDLETRQLLVRVGATARENYRRVFTSSDPTVDDTEPGTAWDAGAEMVADYKQVFDEDLTYTSRLSVYQPFKWSKTDEFDAVSSDSLVAAGLPSDIADYTTAVDINWQNTLTAQVTKIIAVQLYLELLYDKYDNSLIPIVESGTVTNADAVRAAVRKKGQFKETLGIGITINFM